MNILRIRAGKGVEIPGLNPCVKICCIRGVFCGGTTMAPQYVRFIVEEVLEGRIGFYPTYGNTLMGLAARVVAAEVTRLKLLRRLSRVFVE